MKRESRQPCEVESVLRFISETQKLSGFSGEITPELEKQVMELYRQGKLKQRKALLSREAVKAMRKRASGAHPRKAKGRTHDWIDRRSLALHKAIAQKLLKQPALLQRAKDTLQRWIRRRQPEVPAVLREWQEILSSRSLEEILELLNSFDAEARGLRQSSRQCKNQPDEPIRRSGNGGDYWNCGAH